jgi:hypothetical protein
MQHLLKLAPRWATAALALALLAGCAGTQSLQAEVSTHPQWPAGIPTGAPAYQWERLPSMRSGPQAAEQDALEAAADAVLAQAGWRLDPAQPQWTLSIEGQNLRTPRPPPSHVNIGIGIGIGVGHGRIQLGSLWPESSPPLDRSQVVLLIRPAAQGPIAYETRASREAWGPPNAEQWRAMVQAALRDFPLSSARQQTVTIDLTPKDKAKP